jgi:hypothetical protein
MIHGPEIVIATLDDETEITLTGQHAPNPIPKIQYESQVENINLGGAMGYQVAGTSASRGTIEINVKYLSSQQVTDLVALRDAQPASRFKITLDGGDNWHRCIFQPGGLELSSWTAPNWAMTKGVIRLFVTGVYNA